MQNHQYKKIFSAIGKNKSLDLSQGGHSKGKMIIWSANNGNNQQFAIVHVQGDQKKVRIINKHNGECLSVESEQNGAKVSTAK